MENTSDTISDPHTKFTIPVASGNFYPSDSHIKTEFELKKNDNNEYFIFMERTDIIPEGYGFKKEEIVEGIGFPITNEEYTSLITPPFKTRIGISKSTYTYRDIRKYGLFKINVKGGMKRKTNKRKRKNARKSRKYK